MKKTRNSWKKRQQEQAKRAAKKAAKKANHKSTSRRSQRRADHSKTKNSQESNGSMRFISKTWAEFGLTEQQIRAAVDQPLFTSELADSGDVVGLTGLISVATNEWARLVVIGKPGPTFEVWYALHIPSALSVFAGTNEPVELLRLLASKFGTPIRLGGKLGNFFLNEKIPFSSTGDTLLAEAPGDRTSSYFVQVLRTIAGEQGRVLDVALAFCLDLDRYRNAVAVRAAAASAPSVFLAEPLKGQFTHHGLISYAGALMATVRAPDDTTFFSVSGFGYQLEAGIRAGRLFLRRNEDILEAPTPSLPAGGAARIFVRWLPSRLEVAAEKAPPRNPPEVKKLETKNTFPPPELSAWARRNALLPTTTFATRGDVFSLVLASKSNGVLGPNRIDAARSRSRTAPESSGSRRVNVIGWWTAKNLGHRGALV